MTYKKEWAYFHVKCCNFPGKRIYVCPPIIATPTDKVMLESNGFCDSVVSDRCSHYEQSWIQVNLRQDLGFVVVLSDDRPLHICQDCYLLKRTFSGTCDLTAILAWNVMFWCKMLPSIIICYHHWGHAHMNWDIATSKPSNFMTASPIF